MRYLEKYNNIYIDWKQYYNDKSDISIDIRNDVVINWLIETQKKKKNFTLVKSTNIHYLTYFEPKLANKRIETMENILNNLMRNLPIEIFKNYIDRSVVIEFENQDDYYEYITYFYDLTENDSHDSEIIELPMSGAVHVSDGYYSYVIMNKDSKLYLTKTYAHEFMHVLMYHYRIPIWLNEGFATVAEQINGQSVYGINQYNIDDHKKYWTKDKLNDFFNGLTYKDENGFNVSYDLSYMITMNLLKEKNIMEILNKFKINNSDDNDFKKITGIDPNDYLPNYIQELVYKNG